MLLLKPQLTRKTRRTSSQQQKVQTTRQKLHPLCMLTYSKPRQRVPTIRPIKERQHTRSLKKKRQFRYNPAIQTLLQHNTK